MKKLLLILSFILLFMSNKSNAQCSAAFDYYNTIPNPTLFTFVDSSSGTSGWVIYQWTFGDGTTDSVQNPQHLFPINGSHSVCLTITDSIGCTSTYCDSVLVTPIMPTINAYLNVDSLSQYNCTSPDSINFFYYGYASGYNLGDSLLFEINFGDGVDSSFYISSPNLSFQGIFHHIYLNAGSYTAQLIVTGPDSTSSSSTAQTITITATCGSVSGIVYDDINGNCTYDTGEELPNISLTIYNGSQFGGWTSTDAAGLYSFNVPSGNTYEIHVNASNGNFGHFTPTCPPSGILTVSTIPSSGNNFGVACPSGFDLQGYITGWGFRPGFTSSVCVNVFNQFCNTPSGQIDIIFPSSLTPLPDSGTSGYTINGNTVSLAIDSTSLYWSFCIPATVSLSSQIGDSVCIEMNISPSAGDANPSNNSGTFCFAIRNSYDPNDKYATPAGEGAEGYIKPNTDLTYTIRFQNTGNAEAINIYLLDTLNSNLDATSVKVIASSHDVNFALLTGNILRFSYDNINLADSNTNEPASHGYITYRVSQMSNVVQLAEIKNTAYIYFDFNPPIVTNTTLNTVDQFLAIHPINNYSSLQSVYPNPANQKCVLTFNDNNQKIITVSDALGNIVFKRLIPTDSYVLNTEKFAAGIYSIHITDYKNQRVTEKLIVAH